ncbi:unnamed protein product [Choristocarpus tenellus]
MLLGGIAGACIGGVLVDWIGRWRTIVVTALIFVVGGVTLFLATTVGEKIETKFVYPSILGHRFPFCSK